MDTRAFSRQQSTSLAETAGPLPAGGIDVRGTDLALAAAGPRAADVGLPRLGRSRAGQGELERFIADIAGTVHERLSTLDATNRYGQALPA